MAFLHSKDCVVMLNGVKASMYIKSASLSADIDMGETNVLDADSKSRLTGLRDAKLSLEGHVDTALDASFDMFKDALGEKYSHVAIIPQGDGTRGNTAMLFKGIAGSYELGIDIDNPQSLQMEVSSDESFLQGFVLLGQTTVAADGQSTSYDMGSAAANGLAAFLHLESLGGGTVVLKIQHSADNSAWVDLFTATIGGTAPASERFSTASSVNRYLRVSYDVTGTTAVKIAAEAARL